MSKMNAEGDSNVVDLGAFRKDKFALKIKIGGYYAHPELGVHLHCVGVTDKMHTKNNEVHFVVEDHFGNIASFRTDDPPPGFVYSNMEEFAAACLKVVDSIDENLDEPPPAVS